MLSMLVEDIQTVILPRLRYIKTVFIAENNLREPPLRNEFHCWLIHRCRLFHCDTFGCSHVREWQVWKTASTECLLPSLSVDKTGELKCDFEVSHVVSGE